MDEILKKKNNKGALVLMLTAGIFMSLVGVMGYSKSPELVDSIVMFSGVSIIGASVYRLVVPVK